MVILRRLIAFISSLKVAIFLLFVIAIASALGTAIPQGESIQNYLEIYQERPWLGFINGENLIRFQLDHIYSSNWFLSLLGWLAISLIICSWRRQLPMIKSALQWIDYKKPRQISKFAIAETVQTKKTNEIINQLAEHLQKKGWNVRESTGRLAARKGAIGRIGPPIIHLGLVLLLFGSAWGSLQGQRIERFLVPGRSFELLNKEGQTQLTLRLNNFQIERDPAGRTEQFRSNIEIIEPGQNQGLTKEASVNHPIRFKGMTVYQADWSLVAITIQIGQSPELQLPLQSFPELGEQIWGLVLPTNTDGSNPVLISVSSEKGPVQIFDENGQLLGSLRPGSDSKEIKGIPIRIIKVLPASGLLLKRDPGVPIVYTSFAITLIGGALSILATRQLWAIAEPDKYLVHIGALSNRNLSSLANEMPQLIAFISSE